MSVINDVLVSNFLLFALFYFFFFLLIHSKIVCINLLGELHHDIPCIPIFIIIFIYFSYSKGKKQGKKGE
jgi:hypothetical protein